MALSSAYRRYMKSEKWFNLREKRMELDNYQCQFCNGVGKTLEVHHLTYDNFMDENLEDLVTTCVNCHKYLDRIRKIIKHFESAYPEKIDAVIKFYGYPHDMPQNREVLKGMLKSLKQL